MLAAVLVGCGGGRTKIADQTAKPPLLIIPEEPAHLTPAQQMIKDAWDKNGYRLKGEKPTVLMVHKATRQLTVYQGLTPLKTYPVVLGGNPVGDKLRQGDLCTPEGVYQVVTKFDHSRWSKFILIDYPNTQNWLKFSEAKKKGRIPLDADIGGEVGIHGTDDTYKNLCGENWTKGCVSMLNHHIEEIYPLVSDKTLIIITKR
jgi:murein L,D-transpeptidase YafK